MKLLCLAGVILHLLPQLPVLLIPFILERWAEPLVTQELHFHQSGSKMKKQIVGVGRSAWSMLEEVRTHRCRSHCSLRLFFVFLFFWKSFTQDRQKSNFIHPRKQETVKKKNRRPESTVLSISDVKPRGDSAGAEKQLLFLLERRITGAAEINPPPVCRENEI